MKSLGLPLLIGALTLASKSRAAEVGVATAAELAAAVAAAKAGDTLVLEPGEYAMGGVLCSAMGAPDAPITVRARVPGDAHIAFDAVEGFHVTGAHWHFEGLDVRGVCASDDLCEHAFHVTGGDARGFVLRRSRVRDFNAQLKVNATPDADGVYRAADGGRVEYCDLGDGHARATANPTTKLNIDGGSGWVVRGNFLHDFHKGGGDGVSYGAFMKSGGRDGLFERNLVVCSHDDASGGVRIGLSFGGGGTAPQYCAPAFDPSVPCDVEHENGIVRNNLIVACSDVGIYVNRGKNTRVLHNTLVDTAGIDFRFPTTTGEARGNLLTGTLRARDGGSFAESDNVQGQSIDAFLALYVDPLGLDFRVKGDASSLHVAPAMPDLLDDYCARARPASPITVGALEHSLGDCTVNPPPESSSGRGVGGGPGRGGVGSAGGAGTQPVGSGGASSTGAATTSDTDPPAPDGGGGCRMSSRSVPPAVGWMGIGLAGLSHVRRRRRSGSSSHGASGLCGAAEPCPQTALKQSHRGTRL